MKLSQDPTARARMRLLHPWPTGAQLGALDRTLEDVEFPSKPSLPARISASWHGARITCRIRSLAAQAGR